MSLSYVTPEWEHIANEITLFVIRRRENSEAEFQALAQTPMILFNQWAQERGCAVASPDLALWCLDYFRTLTKMPLERVRKAALLDGLLR